jgi:hypothetical protein
MNGIPSDINPETLPGPKRDGWSYDKIIWSPNTVNFILAYSIREISNNNPVGRFLYGTFDGANSHILANPQRSIFCWGDLAHWVTNDVFVVKISHFSKNNGYFYPLIAFHIKNGFYVIPDSDNLESKPSDIKDCNFIFTEFDDKKLDEILNIYPFDSSVKPTLLERLFRG